MSCHVKASQPRSHRTVLQQNSRLDELDLASNGMDGPSIAYISDCFQRNIYITKLVNICIYITKLVNICRYITKLINICRYITKLINICRYITKLVNTCRYITKLVNIYLALDRAESERISFYVTTQTVSVNT